MSVERKRLYPDRCVARVSVCLSLSLPSTAAVILSYTAVEEERGRETRQIQGTLLSFFLLVNLSNSRSLFLYTCRLLDRLINQKERQRYGCLVPFSFLAWVGLQFTPGKARRLNRAQARRETCHELSLASMSGASFFYSFVSQTCTFSFPTDKEMPD